jgi:hypothetical protein
MDEMTINICAVGFDALLKQSDKCSNVDGRYIENEVLFSSFRYHMFYILYLFVTCLLTLPHNSGW